MLSTDNMIHQLIGKYINDISHEFNDYFFVRFIYIYIFYYFIIFFVNQKLIKNYYFLLLNNT